MTTAMQAKPSLRRDIPLRSCSECKTPLLDYIVSQLCRRDPQDEWDEIADGYASNNTAPGIRETDVFRGRVEAGREESVWIDEQIERLSDLLERLKLLRESRASKTKIYAAALNPVRRIPNDILLEIFSWCIADEDKLDPTLAITDPAIRNRFLLIQQTPWMLSQVCSSWRSAAFSSPDLWSNIFYYHDTTRGNNLTGQSSSNLLICRLANAGSRPISVTIVAADDAPFSTNGPPPFIRSLVVSSPRWKSIFLCIPPSCYDFLREMRYMLRNLRSVSISSHAQTIGEISQERYWKAFHTANNLTAISCHPFLTSSLKPEQLRRITHYSIPPTAHGHVSFSTEFLLLNLALMPNLTSLSIFCRISPLFGYLPSPQPENLDSLTIVEDPERNTVLDLLKSMTPHSLLTLKVYSKEAIRCIINSQFLTRSKPSLRSLTVGFPVKDADTGDLDVNLDSLIRIFKACPSITELVLGSCLSLKALVELSSKSEANSLSNLTLLAEGMMDEEMMKIRAKVKKIRPELSVHFRQRSFFLPPLPFY